MVVVAAHWLLWICVDEFKSYYRFYNNNTKHVLMSFFVCVFYTEYTL